MKNNIDILFIGHDASRTGAPIILLNQLKWFKEHSDLNFIILLKNGGELEKDYQNIAPTYIWNQNTSYSLKERVLRKIKLQTQRNTQPLKEFLISKSPKIIYANSVVSTDLAIELRNSLSKCIVICHIHELEVAINRYFGKKNFNKTKFEIDQYIAVSNAVKDNLITNHQLNTSKIEKIAGFVPALEYSLKEKTKDAIKSDVLLKNNNTLVVGGCGTIDWRKSPDLFIQVANYVKKEAPNLNIHFVWIGGETQGTKFDQLQNDIQLCELDNISFIGAKKNGADYFLGFDMFLLSSREDPFPLVCLEAASMSIPILCFDKAGGMKEFVETDSGFVVPYLDTKKMADKIILLALDEKQRKEIGQIAQRKAIEKHDVSVSCSEIERLLKSHLNG